MYILVLLSNFTRFWCNDDQSLCVARELYEEKETMSTIHRIGSETAIADDMVIGIPARRGARPAEAPPQESAPPEKHTQTAVSLLGEQGAAVVLWH